MAANAVTDAPRLFSWTADRAVDNTAEKLFQDANLDFAELKKDRKAWDEELAERKLWEPALLDGIEDE